jgi:hypothetical protein
MLTVNKNQAITKLNRLIEDGRQHAGQVIEHVMNNQPLDHIKDASELVFSGNGNLRVGFDNKEFALHRFALGQVAETANLPTKFIDSLTGADWGRALIAHNLNEIFQHNSKRRLLRTVNNEVRGFLSDQYRRLDSRPLVEAFAVGVQKLGALTYKGSVMDTKINVAAIMPDVYEVAGEVLAFVMSFENSDFGNGAVSLRSGLVRIWCDNLHVFEETLRQIHLGKRLADDIMYSRQTYELDTQTTVSALSDLINSQLNREGIQKRLELVQNAANTEVNPAQVQKMLKDALGIGRAQEVIDVYKSADIENVPAGNSVWRMANAISWVANKETDGEKKLELVKLAGRVMLPGKKGVIPFAEAEVVEEAVAA